MNKKSMQRSRGVAMIEFALMLPLLLLILFGVTEIGRALYQQNTLYKAITVGSRYMARVEGIITLNNQTCATAGDYATAEQAATNLIICGRKDTCGSDAIIPNLTDSGITITVPAQAVLYDTTRTLYACIIRIEAEAPFDGLFDLGIPMTSIGSFDLRAETEERYIGY